MELAKCPCGGTPEILNPSPNRIAKRDAAEKKLGAALSLNERDFRKAQVDAMKAIADLKSTDEKIVAAAWEHLENAPPLDRSLPKIIQSAEAAVAALQGDVVEVRCPKCASFLWEDDEHYAVGVWNRMVEKLATLKPCCRDKANHIAKPDQDGEPLVKCSVCGVRHYLLGAA